MIKDLLKSIISLGLLASSVLVSAAADAITIIPEGYQVEVIPTGDFELIQSSGLVIDNSNNIYISRNFFDGTSDILKIAPSGNISSIANLEAFIGGLALNQSNQLFGSLDNGKVFKIENNTVNIISEFGNTLSTPVLLGVTFDNMNNLFVTQLGKGFQTGIVFKLSPEGIPTIVVEQLNGPWDVEFVDDSLFIADSSRILQRTPSGNLTTFFDQIPGEIIDFEYDFSSNSFFFGGFIGDKVNILSNGQVTTFAEGFDSFARALAFNSQGDLYVSDATQLYKISRRSISKPVPESDATLGLLLFGTLGAFSVRKRK